LESQLMSEAIDAMRSEGAEIVDAANFRASSNSTRGQHPALRHPRGPEGLLSGLLHRLQVRHEARLQCLVGQTVREGTVPDLTALRRFKPSRTADGQHAAAAASAKVPRWSVTSSGPAGSTSIVSSIAFIA
jgi:hypothetical protein